MKVYQKKKTTDEGKKKLTFLSCLQSNGCLQQTALRGWPIKCITSSGHAVHLSCDAIGQYTHRQRNLCLQNLCLQMKHACLLEMQLM